MNAFAPPVKCLNGNEVTFVPIKHDGSALWMLITGTKTEKQPSRNKSPHGEIEAAACDCNSVGLRDESFGVVRGHPSRLPRGRASQRGEGGTAVHPLVTVFDSHFLRWASTSPPGQLVGISVAAVSPAPRRNPTNGMKTSLIGTLHAP